jgi:hypothetical protein
VKSVTERRGNGSNGASNGANGAGYASVEPSSPPEEVPVQPRMLQVEPREPIQTQALDAPFCYSCGSKMIPAGSCYVCTACGSTSGCS